MQDKILPKVIFSPGQLALELTQELTKQSVEVRLYTPGPVRTPAVNVKANLSLFEAELRGRGYGYLELLQKHPMVFVSLARQVQAELIAKAFRDANNGELDIVHIYTNEEDIALPFVQFCQKPVVLTHHDPFNFLIKYKNTFPKFKDLNWLSISLAQRTAMPSDTNWLANIYHGLDKNRFKPVLEPEGDYVAYLGRIIEPKGVHLAMAAVKAYNQRNNNKLKLKIAGKHYSSVSKDTYWETLVKPQLDEQVEYNGFIDNDEAKQTFLGNAKALIVPSVFEEPFGMVVIEALACGTPVIGLDSGAITELVKTGQNGVLIDHGSEQQIIKDIALAVEQINQINRQACRQDFEQRFTLQRMAKEHIEAYTRLING